jgi:Tol biopolymer transport system component
MRRLFAVIVLSAAAAGAIGAYTGRIVFTTDRDVKTEIYTVNPDGTGLTRLTNNKADDEQPALSPDGSRVAFCSNRDGNYDIYLMGADGKNVRRLTKTAYPESDPSFSADGKWVIYTSQAEGGRDVWRINLETLASEKLIGGEGDQFLGREAADHTLVYVENLGDDEVMIREPEKAPRKLAPSPNLDTMPAFCPDGTRVYFVSNREGDYDTYVVNRDGTGLKPCISLPSLEGRPAPSPDGLYLCVPSNADGDLDLYVYSMAGEKLGQLTANDGYSDYEPFWGP